MKLNREDFPHLTDDEFDAINWQSIEGICDRCHQIGVKCYHILKAGMQKLNGDACFTRLQGGLNFYWHRDIKKLLSSDDNAILNESTSGHFCLKCADVVLECEIDYMTQEFGHYLKDDNITFCLTQIREHILMLHVK